MKWTKEEHDFMSKCSREEYFKFLWAKYDEMERDLVVIKRLIKEARK